MNTEIETFNEGIETFRPSAAIDPERLEYLWTLAERMARSTLVPETLKTVGNKNNKKDLPHEVIVANVFAVVEQADRWNISPFALLACSAIVHGKLGFEGKVISSVLESRYGIDLDYEWSGEGENRKITITGFKPGSDKPLIVEGTVKDWKTTGDGSPWRPSTYDKMLAYRGSREWARLHKASAILGVLGDDEILSIGMERQAQMARDITPSLTDRFGGKTSSDGFNPNNVRQITNSGQAPMERVDTKTGEVIESGVQRETAAKTTPSTKAASAKPVSGDAGRGGATSEKDSRPNQSETSGVSPQGAGVGSGGTNSDAAPADSSSPSNGGSKDDGDGGQVKSPSLTAEQLKKYLSYLARMSDSDKIDRASEEFMKEIGGAPAKGSVDYKVLVSIYQRQKRRAAGEIEGGALMEEITLEIDQMFGATEHGGL